MINDFDDRAETHFGPRIAVMSAKRTTLGILQVTAAVRALETLLISKIFINSMAVMYLSETCLSRLIR